MSKVTFLFLGGSSWSPSGVGSGVVSVETISQSIFLYPPAGGSLRFWLAGNGSSPLLYSSMTVTQGNYSINVLVNWQSSFYAPADGRWSDYISISSFSLPGYVTVMVVFPHVSAAPTYSWNNQTLAPTVPDTPVAVSAVQTQTQPPKVPLKNPSLPFYDDCTSLDHYRLENFGLEVSDGFHIHLPELTEPDTSNGAGAYIVPFIDTLPDQFSVEIITRCDLVPINYWCNFLFYLQTPKRAFGMLCLAAPMSMQDVDPGVDYGCFEFLYTPLLDTEQKWRYEYDMTDPANFQVNVFHDDRYVGSSRYLGFFEDISGEPDRQSGMVFEAENHYDTHSAMSMHILSIKIWEGITDISLTEIGSTAKITVNSNPAAGDTLTIAGGSNGDIIFTFVNANPTGNQILIGVDANATAANIAAAINAIYGAEFVATATGNVVTIKAYVGDLTLQTLSGQLTIGAVSSMYPEAISENATVADAFSYDPIGGKAIKENVSVNGSVDGLIDKLSESVSAQTVIASNMDIVEEEVSVSTKFDGLIDSMGDDIFIEYS